MNESIIVFPLFNVKICDIFKVLHLSRVLCHSVSIHIHSVDLGSSNLYVVVLSHLCDSTIATEAEHDMLSKSVCGVPLGIQCAHEMPATPPLPSYSPIFIYFSKYMYIFST